jgi:hypothetical protein
MRQSFRRAGPLTVAFLLTLAGMVALTGTASAAKSQKTLRVASVTQACGVSICARDVVTIPAGQRVDTYCVHPNGQLNLSYTNPTFGRGGYIPVGNFQSPNVNTEVCGPFSGSFARTKIDTSLGSCSGPCVNFGGVPKGEQLRAFCHLPPDSPEWLLVYETRNSNAGFVRVSALDINPSVPSCNQGF